MAPGDGSRHRRSRLDCAGDARARANYRTNCLVLDGVIDNVNPGQEAVENGPENGLVKTPRDRDGEGAAKADTRLCGSAGRG